MTINEQISLISGAISRLRSKDIDASDLESFKRTLVAKQRDGEEASQQMPDTIREHVVAEHTRRSARNYIEKKRSGEIDRREFHRVELDEVIEAKKLEISKLERSHRGDPAGILPLRRKLKNELQELETQRASVVAEHASERESFEFEDPVRQPNEEELAQLVRMQTELKEIANYSGRYPMDTSAKVRWSAKNREVKKFAEQIGATS